jgi:hypothetical protein
MVLLSSPAEFNAGIPVSVASDEIQNLCNSDKVESFVKGRCREPAMSCDPPLPGFAVVSAVILSVWGGVGRGWIAPKFLPDITLACTVSCWLRTLILPVRNPQPLSTNARIVYLDTKCHVLHSK